MSVRGSDRNFGVLFLFVSWNDDQKKWVGSTEQRGFICFLALLNSSLLPIGKKKRKDKTFSTPQARNYVQPLQAANTSFRRLLKDCWIANIFIPRGSPRAYVSVKRITLGCMPSGESCATLQETQKCQASRFDTVRQHSGTPPFFVSFVVLSSGSMSDRVVQVAWQI